MFKTPEYYTILMDWVELAIDAMDHESYSLAKSMLELGHQQSKETYLEECRKSPNWFLRRKARKERQ